MGCSTAAALSCSFAARTDVGRARALNQDSVDCAPLEAGPDPGSPGGLLLSVFDGMGGGQGGEVASQVASAAVRRGLAALGPGDDPGRGLDEALQGAHQVVRATARSLGLRDMGTTATVALVQGRRAWIGQVGDSRAYLLRGGQLRQLTRDQSLVQQLIEQGALRPEDARTFEHGNIILQALGTTSPIEAAIGLFDLLPGDTLLLCSDGLWGELPDAQMALLLASCSDPAEACRLLIDAANEAGGSDNISCVVCRLDGPFFCDEQNLLFPPKASPPDTAPSDEPLPALPLRSPLLLLGLCAALGLSLLVGLAWVAW